MPAPRLQTVLQHLRQAAGTPSASPVSDGDLLTCFTEHGDEAAFVTLVQRHGPMVQELCRRWFGQQADADDVWQATFLVLARRARSIRHRGCIAGWLHGVACRLAVKARRDAARRRKYERQTPVRGCGDPDCESVRQELYQALDQELERLSQTCRVPLVLCYLQAHTRDETARLLGVSLRTLDRRLEHGRKLLRTRLERRGLTLSAVFLAAGIGQQPVSAIGMARLGTAVLQASGARAAAGVCDHVSARAVLLAETMTGTTKVGMKMLLAVLVAVGGVIGVCRTLMPLQPDNPRAMLSPPANQLTPQAKRLRTDIFGDPLPAGALVRFGTVRWRLGSGLASTMLVTPDGTRLLAANSVYGITVYDTATGRPVRKVPGAYSEWLSYSGAVALSADGKTAVFGSKAGTVYVVDIPTGTERRRCLGHRGLVREAALSADGRTLVTRSDDASLRVWDTASGKQLQQLTVNPQHDDQFRLAELALSANGDTVAWVGDGWNLHTLTVHVCDTRTGAERHSIPRRKDIRCRTALSPDGKRLLVGGDTEPAELWDLRAERVLNRWPARGHWPPALGFAPDRKTAVLTAGMDGMRVFDTVTGKLRWRAPRLYQSTLLDAFAFSPDGKELFVAQGGEHVLHRYELATGKSLDDEATKRGVVSDIAFSPDGRWIHTGTTHIFRATNSFSRWDAATGRFLRTQQLNTWPQAFSPDGRWLVGYRDGALHVYETATGKELRQFDVQSTRGVTCLAWSPDSRRVAAGFADGKGPCVAVWDVATGKSLCQIRGLNETPAAITFAPDGKQLLGDMAWGVPVPKLLCWDVATGRECAPITLPGSADQFKLSPDGRVLALLTEKFHIQLWEQASGHMRAALPPVRLFSTVMAFSADSDLFLVADGEGPVCIYDARSGLLLRRLVGHGGQVTAFAFSPDGCRLATASEDTTALVWDVSDLVRNVRGPRPLMKQQLIERWHDLAGDAGKAGQALADLRAAPAQAVPLLQEQVRPFRPRETPQAAQWIRDLDSPRFAVRERATRELAAAGEAIKPSLEKALAAQPSAEVRRRLKHLLDNLATPQGNRLRELRAVDVLEHIGTPEARLLLLDLARGASWARLTQEAQAAMDRLNQHNGARR